VGGGQGIGTVESDLDESAPELADEDAERLLPGRRGRVAPEDVRELVPRDRPSVLG